MKRTLKAGLLAGVSAAAIVLTMAPAAHAFDTVDWRWDAAITEVVEKNVTINIDIAPTGMTMLESLQAHIGSVTATSTVTDINNTQPNTVGGEVDGGVIPFQFHYGLGGTGVVVLDDDFKSPAVLSATVDEGDQAPNINGTVVGSLAVGLITVPATESFDAATELASIVSAATAVGNNLSVESEVATQLHIGQFLIGGSNGEAQLPPDLGTSNSNLTIAGALAMLTMNGSLQSANVSATSTVSGILNASVDSAATAVANNVSISGVPSSAANGLLIGDVTQFALANVSANSNVSGVNINYYTGLGSLTRPIVNSTATAVGNNASVSVKTPVIATP